MRSPRQNPSNNNVLGYLLMGTLVLLLLPRGWTDRLDDLLAVAVSPLSGPSRAVSLAVTGQLRGNEYGPAVSRQQYKRLAQAYRNSELQLANKDEQLARLQELNAQLAGLRSESWSERARFIRASVVGNDSSNRRRIKTLNRGTREHIEVGQMVLSAAPGRGVGARRDIYEMCVVGRVIKSGQRTSHLQLLSDPGFRLQVLIKPAASRQESWHSKAILSGSEDGSLIVTKVPRHKAVQPGDLVLARSDARDLPTAMFIGRVKHCRIDDSTPIMWRIVVEPAVDLELLRDVVAIDLLPRD